MWIAITRFLCVLTTLYIYVNLSFPLSISVCLPLKPYSCCFYYDFDLPPATRDYFYCFRYIHQILLLVYYLRYTLWMCGCVCAHNDDVISLLSAFWISWMRALCVRVFVSVSATVCLCAVHCVPIWSEKFSLRFN